MIKTLSKQVKGFVKESVLTPVFMILEVVFETLIPLLMASIIDDGINKGDMNHILFVGGGMVLCAIGGLICGILGGSFGAKASAGFARNLRRSMFANIQTFSFSNIDKYSTMIKQQQTEKRKWIINPQYCIKYNLSAKTVRNMVKGKINNELIGLYF